MKQKENYNFHKQPALADYGYDSMRLNNDWQGDFIAVKNDEISSIKRRFQSIKYIDKEIHIAFIENNIVKYMTTMKL